MSRLLKFISSVVLIAAAFPVDAAVTYANRHVLIVEGGVDEVWASYLFAVENDQEKPEAATLPLMFPKETLDWQAQEGVRPENIVLGKKGGVTVTDEFKPGSTLLGIALKIRANLGEAKMTFELPTDINQLTILMPPGRMDGFSDKMQKKEGVSF